MRTLSFLQQSLLAELGKCSCSPMQRFLGHRADEVRSHTSLIAEKSGLTEPAVQEIVALLFESIGTVPYSLPSSALQKARTAIGDTDSDDVPYLATAITVDRAVIWSDDAVFDEQHYVPWYPTRRVLKLYDDDVLVAS